MRGCESPIRSAGGEGVKMHSFDWLRKARLPGEIKWPGSERGAVETGVGEGEESAGGLEFQRDSVE